jgi:hypothetical protein
MARGYPGIVYPFPMFPSSHSDVERMSRESMRYYLRHRLKSLDAQINALAREHLAACPQHRTASGRAATTCDGWEGMLEITYLQSMRDAIVDTLAAL